MQILVIFRALLIPQESLALRQQVAVLEQSVQRTPDSVAEPHSPSTSRMPRSSHPWSVCGTTVLRLAVDPSTWPWTRSMAPWVLVPGS